MTELGVATQPSHMSFSVSDDDGSFEYAGTPRGLLAQPAHLVSPRFLRMLADLRRFNREARDLIGLPPAAARRCASSSARGATPSGSSSG